MGRGKTVLARIENPVNRRVTFSKRKMGLLKKAHELSILCDVEIALVIFSAKGRLYEFGSPNMEKTIRRYIHINASRQNFNHKDSAEVLQLELGNLQKDMDNLVKTNKHMIGEEIDSLSLYELDQYEKLLQKGSRRIRSKKEKILKEELKSLREQTQMCRDQNVIDRHIHSRGVLCGDKKYEDKNERPQDHDQTHLIRYEAGLDLSL